MNISYYKDSIVAIATPPGKGGVGIIRVSGQNLKHYINKLTPQLKNITPRYAHYCHFYDENSNVIDSGLLIYFEKEKSFTGEEIFEIQAHGGPVILNLLLERCLQLNLRLAEPGEFSKRAYLNNKIDLLQAESIADLIEAGSRSAALAASRSLQGDFSKKIKSINHELTQIRALVEGSLDFPEEHINFLAEFNIKEKLLILEKELIDIINSAQQGSILRDGLSIMLMGAPNVGKSSLLNALAQNDVAIVTNIAGTTRDLLKEEILINDLKINFIDTAGLRETEDFIEKIGIEKSQKLLETVNMVLILVDQKEGINDKTQHIIDQFPKNLKKIFVYNKIDLIDQQANIIKDEKISVYISVKNNLGLDLLKKTIIEEIGFHNNDENQFIARQRHLKALKNTLFELSNGLSQFELIDLLAEHLKLSQNYLQEMTGEFNSDDLLGVIFSQFCIGK